MLVNIHNDQDVNKKVLSWKAETRGKNMKKIYAILISLVLISFVPVIPTVLASDVTVTGSFTATGTLDVDVNDSTPAFGTITAGNSATVELKVTNNGDVTADVTQTQASKDSGTLTIGTAGGLGADEYSVETWSNDGTSSWEDIGAGTAVIADALAVSGEQNYTMRVTVSSEVGQASDANQFSADTSVAADT